MNIGTKERGLVIAVMVAVIVAIGGVVFMHANRSTYSANMFRTSAASEK